MNYFNVFSLTILTACGRAPGRASVVWFQLPSTPPGPSKTPKEVLLTKCVEEEEERVRLLLPLEHCSTDRGGSGWLPLTVRDPTHNQSITNIPTMPPNSVPFNRKFHTLYHFVGLRALILFSKMTVITIITIFNR